MDAILYCQSDPCFGQSDTEDCSLQLERDGDFLFGIVPDHDLACLSADVLLSLLLPYLCLRPSRISSASHQGEIIVPTEHLGGPNAGV